MKPRINVGILYVALLFIWISLVTGKGWIVIITEWIYPTPDCNWTISLPDGVYMTTQKACTATHGLVAYIACVIIALACSVVIIGYSVWRWRRS